MGKAEMLFELDSTSKLGPQFTVNNSVIQRRFVCSKKSYSFFTGRFFPQAKLEDCVAD
jgi:hypothetical protein